MPGWRCRMPARCRKAGVKPCGPHSLVSGLHGDPPYPPHQPQFTGSSEVVFLTPCCFRCVNLGPPACTPPPFHCLGKHSLCNIISFSSTFKIQEILFSLQTCTFLKKRRFSEDVVFQKSTSRQHGSTRFRIRRLPGATRDKPTTY